MNDMAPKYASLVQAVADNNIERAEEALQSGIHPDEADMLDGMPLLHAAAKAGQADMFDLLIEYGARLDRVEEANGFTVLHRITDSQNKRTDGARAGMAFRAIQSGQMDLDAVEPRHQRPALHYAAINGFSKVIEVLYAGGADLHARDKNGAGGMHYACSYAHPEAVRKLLQLGAPLDIMDSEGRKPKDALKIATGKQSIKARQVIAHFEAMPELGWEQPMTKEMLFQNNEHAMAPLENPKTLHRLETVFDGLQANGECITKDDWFGPSTDGERRWIEVAVESGVLDKVLAQLTHQGEKLEPGDLQCADGKPSYLTEELIRHFAVGELFKTDAVRGQSVEGIRQLYHALPKEAQDQVGNYQRLLAYQRTAVRQASMER